jgi:hypothetical protein
MSTLQAIHETIWLKTFLVKLDFKQKEAIIVLIDNQGSISFIKNLVHHNWSKHNDTCHHYLKELVYANEVTFKYYSNSKMRAKLLTTGIFRTKHCERMQKMGFRQLRI